MEVLITARSDHFNITLQYCSDYWHRPTSYTDFSYRFSTFSQPFSCCIYGNQSRRTQVKTYPSHNVPTPWSRRTQVKTYPSQNVPTTLVKTYPLFIFYVLFIVNTKVPFISSQYLICGNELLCFGCLTIFYMIQMCSKLCRSCFKCIAFLRLHCA